MKTQQLIRSVWAASDFEFKYWPLIFIAIYLLAFWPLDRRDVAGFLGCADAG